MKVLLWDSEALLSALEAQRCASEAQTPRFQGHDPSPYGRSFQNGLLNAHKNIMGIILFLAIGFLFAIGLVIAALKRAPQGAEDDSGYCLLWQNKNSKAVDVSCIWATATDKGTKTVST